WPVDLDDTVVDSQSRECSEQVLGEFDRGTVSLKRCSAVALDRIGDRCGDFRTTRQIRSDETDAGVWLGWEQGRRYVGIGKESPTGDHGRSREGPLLRQVSHAARELVPRWMIKG